MRTALPLHFDSRPAPWLAAALTLCLWSAGTLASAASAAPVTGAGQYADDHDKDHKPRPDPLCIGLPQLGDDQRGEREYRGAGTVTPIDPASFAQMQAAGTLKVVDCAELHRQQQQQQADNAANQALVAAFFASHPANAFLANPMNLRPDPAVVPIEPVGDGNFRVSYVDSSGALQFRITLGTPGIYASLANGIRTVPTRDNQYAIYASFYQNLQKYQISLTINDVALPSPDIVSDFNAADIQALNQQIVQYWPSIGQQVPISIIDGSPPATCQEEIGAGVSDGTTGDRSAANNALSASGVMALANYPFPLKPFVTCV